MTQPTGLKPPRLSQQHVRERMEMLRELMHTRGLSEDEREQCMRDLVRIQRGNVR